jgi:hypothetical protein
VGKLANPSNSGFIQHMTSLLRLALALTAATTYLKASRADFLSDYQAIRRMHPEQYPCQRVSAPLKIDGKLDESAWSQAQWTRDFRDIEGDGKPKPRFRTRAKMLWDDDYFYIGAELEEPDVWGTLSAHDAVIFQDPDFEVFIDPDGDRQNYYEFEMNALNTTWDLLLRKAYIDGGPALNEWEIPGLKSAVQIQGSINNPRDRDEGWTLEIAIPWKALAEYSKQPAPPKPGDTWRVNFSRVEWKIESTGGVYKKIPGTKEDNWVWSPTGIIDMHRPEQWGIVCFADSPGKVLPNPENPERDAVLDGYYRQKEFRNRNGRWAKDLKELDRFAAPVRADVRIDLQTQADAWEITAKAAPRGSGKTGLVRITSDGLLREE